MKLDELSKKELVELLWDALRMEACVTKLKACRIVVVHKSDIQKMVDRIKP